MRLTWKRFRETWHPDSYHLRINKVDVGYVRELRRDGGKGFYWYVVSNEYGIPLRNTVSEKQYDTVEEAKVDCETYVRSCLGGVPPITPKQERTKDEGESNE